MLIVLGVVFAFGLGALIGWACGDVGGWQKGWDAAKTLFEPEVEAWHAKYRVLQKASLKRLKRVRRRSAP